ncbi:MAG: hypothetical protein WCR42_00925 [bacterium]
MPASIIASFFSFLITGIYTFYFASYDLTITSDIKIFLFLAIFSNAIYFFVIEALTETDKEIKKKLQTYCIWEWIIRIINQFVLFSLWFLLQWNLLAFAIGLTLLYCLFIVWDRITKANIDNKYIYFTDIIGLCLTVIFLIITFFAIKVNTSIESPQLISKNPGLMLPRSNALNIHFYWGIFVILYFCFPFISLYIMKAKPFNRSLWSRKNIG